MAEDIGIVHFKVIRNIQEAIESLNDWIQMTKPDIRSISFYNNCLYVKYILKSR